MWRVKWTEYNCPPYGTRTYSAYTPNYFSRRDALALFHEATADAEVVIFEVIEVISELDPGELWYLEYYNLDDHEGHL